MTSSRRRSFPTHSWASAPRLRALNLSGISFSAIRNVLLSASDLVHPRLWDITMANSGYVSSEAIANLNDGRVDLLRESFESFESTDSESTPTRWT
jgi:hypothetical protein